VDDSDYQIPFKFTGKLNKLTLTVDRPKLTEEDIKKLKEATRNNRRASQCHQCQTIRAATAVEATNRASAVPSPGSGSGFRRLSKRAS
jgi:hypothetical protein